MIHGYVPKRTNEVDFNKVVYGPVTANPITTDASNQDNVNHPAHYKKGGIETIDYIEAKGFNYNLGNACKYISRANHKGNKIEDLKKAIFYLEREIKNSL